MPTHLRLFGVPIADRSKEKKRVLAAAVILLAALSVVEWYYRLDVSLGIFYTIPVVVAAFVLTRTQIISFGLACAFLRGFFTPANSDLEFFLKFLMASIAYCGSGLLAVEMNLNRRRLLEHYARLRLEQDLRRRAEEQLRILAESSPAAILTINSDMIVLAANLAAHEMLGVAQGELVGKRVDQSFPLFQSALQLNPGLRPVRTAVTGWSRRTNGQTFPVQAWFSIYGEGAEKCLAAIVVDVSEELRDRELDNLRHMLDYNRILAGAVSHEIRNLCSAIAVVCSNLRESADLRQNSDFEALNHLVNGLSRLASVELRRKSNGALEKADLRSVLDQLRVVIEPDWNEIEGSVEYDIPASLPAAQGDAYSLLQIFLNLSQNSCRAVSNSKQRRLRVSVSVHAGDVLVSFIDSGPGVADPDALFHPFRPGADGFGLGLFISRELARSFGGDLVHVPQERGCRFDTIFVAAGTPAVSVTETVSAAG